MLDKDFSFSDQMKFLRQRAELTSRQVSVRSGLSPSYFSKVENGTLLPTIASFAKLMKVLKAEPGEIYYILSTLRDDTEKGEYD